MVRGSLALALALLDIPRRPAKLWPVVGYAAAYEGAADILRRCHQAKISRATITTSTTCNNHQKTRTRIVGQADPRQGSQLRGHRTTLGRQTNQSWMWSGR